MRLARLIVLAFGGASAVRVGLGYTDRSYDYLQEMSAHSSCIGHSILGVQTLLRDHSACPKGIVLMGHVPDELEGLTVPVLILAGTRDGVSSFSRFAALRHRLLSRQDIRIRFGVVAGASHHSFASGPPSPLSARLDLTPDVSSAQGHASIVAIVAAFFGSSAKATSQLTDAETLAGDLSGPVVQALQLEGSAALGQSICDSDYPTNPTCQYRAYPNFSLPFGPKPPPNPMPSSDCVCGSPWVMGQASPLSAGTDLADFALDARDAFHDVSDEHPFHLPHVWSRCASPGPGCSINVTTVTMPVLKAGELFPSPSEPLSAYELKTKFKSRQEIFDAVGAASSPALDQNNSICKSINEKAYAWALSHAAPSVRAAFEAHGEPMVMVDDKPAPIGLTGPTWIKKELVYTRVTDALHPKLGGGNATSRIEVQSWQFVVGAFPVKSKYIPAGMHYCKLLSPARAMEWIYLDGLRASLSLAATGRVQGRVLPAAV